MSWKEPAHGTVPRGAVTERRNTPAGHDATSPKDWVCEHENFARTPLDMAKRFGLTVSNPQATVQAIREWLTGEFSGSTVDSRHIFDKETELFRVQVTKGHHPELEVSR